TSSRDTTKFTGTYLLTSYHPSLLPTVLPIPSYNSRPPSPPSRAWPRWILWVSLRVPKPPYKARPHASRITPSSVSAVGDEPIEFRGLRGIGAGVGSGGGFCTVSSVSTASRELEMGFMVDYGTRGLLHALY
ncbi:hypothetical protein V497_08544, partial [Pseudogymnoascus sp. VKM F-4516 (FW-969)]